MQETSRAGELEEQFEIPWDLGVISVFGAGRHTDGKLYVAMLCEMPQGEAAWLKVVIVRLDDTHLPDPTYGVNGFAEVIFKGDQFLRQGTWGQSMLLQKDERVVVVVRDMDFEIVAGLARFKPDGMLDEAFGDHGVIVHRISARSTNHSAAPSSHEELDAWRSQRGDGAGQVLLLASGKILYFNTTSFLGGPGVGIIARFMPDGRLDQTFGHRGVVRVEPPDSEERAVILWSVCELADGQILASGTVAMFDSMWHRGLVCRYTDEGLPDTTFGDNGFVLVKPPKEFPDSTLGFYRYPATAEARDAFIATSGAFRVESTGTYYGVVSYLDSSGTIVPSFNEGEPVIFGLLGHDQGFHSVAVQDDGKILAAGYLEVLGVTPTHVEFLVARFNPDGTRDLSFAGQGWTSNAFQPGVNYADIMLLDNGSIVVMGTCWGKAIVMRFRA
ncbi:RTX toxins-related Ca2+-binding protein [Paucimonas lemoignei]|nr:RTX toxins-related Ca2+-binding protein [Paucimonas lemoignei]